MLSEFPGQSARNVDRRLGLPGDRVPCAKTHVEAALVPVHDRAMQTATDRRARVRGRGRAAVLTVGMLLPLLACSERNYYLGEFAPLPGLGVAGPAAGLIGDDLVVAGGCDWPGSPPWKDGTPRYHDRILALHYRKKGTDWRPLKTSLPRKLAYAVSVQLEGGVLVAGGSDGARCVADVFVLENIDGENCSVRALPPLPKPLAFACGARIGQNVFIYGGRTRLGNAAETTPSRDLHILSLDAPADGWRKGPALPAAGRWRAAAAVRDGDFHVVGGFLAASDVTPEVWRLREGKTWRRLPDMPLALGGIPSPLPIVHGQMLVFGGDTGEPVARPDRHPGYSTLLFGLAPDESGWIPWSDLPSYVGPDPTRHPELAQMPVVDTTTIPIGPFTAIPSGEIRPGIRATRVQLFVPGDDDPKRAWIALTLILGLGVLPVLGLLYWAFRLHARRTLETS